MDHELKEAQLLNRKQLASITAEDIIELQNEKLSEKEKESIAKLAHDFYKDNFDKVLKLMIFEQLEFLGKVAETQGQFLFGRGTINGLSLIDEWFKKQSGIANPDQEEEESETIPRVG